LRRNLFAFAQAGWRAVIVEPPGQGWSDKPLDWTAYTLPSLAANTLLVLDGLGIRRAPIIGQSLGGGVALQIALDSPQRAIRLALWSPIGFGCARVVHLGSRLPVGLAPLLDRVVGRRLVRFALRIVYGRGHPPSGGDVAEYSAPIASPDFVRAQIQLLRNVRWTPIPDSDLARLTTPVSILAGSGDPIVPAQCLADAAEKLPHGQLRIISGAGHAANETHAGEVNRATIEFLRVPDAAPTV
jgi:4,5:9,10-diseco-3-hydroxy-5,9,17-trioxoandrosta-1(10),2-diene-4-oate hydrolase